MLILENALEIHPVTEADLEEVLEVYRQCEDFLALGPVATASLEMVKKDIEISRDEGGLFCSIHTPGGKMIGVVDVVLNNYQGDPQAAYLSLLMIAAPFRKQGIGKTVVKTVEQEIRKDARINVIHLGVQVNNPQAIQFWKRCGYHIISGPTFMPDQTTVYAMRKDL